MAAKLLSTLNASSCHKYFDDDEITSEEFFKSLKDAEQDFHQIIEEEKINLLVEVEETTDNITSMIEHTIENIDIESYVKDIPLHLQATDCTSSDFGGIEYDADKKHQEELTHSYCTYCTKYERILTVNDVKRGDSIRFQKLLGLYYHHATVTEVVKIDSTSCELTLIHLQKSGKPIMTKVIEDRKQYNFNQSIIEKVIYKSNPYSAEKRVQRAKECMYQNQEAKRYNIAGNNCEHISSRIAQDVSVSPQVISKFDQVKSGISWIFQVFCKLGSKLLRIPGFATIGNLHSMIDIRNKILQLKHFLAAEIVCSSCFDREHKTLKIALAINLISLVISVLSHFNWVTLSITMIVSIAFPLCAPQVAKYIMPLVQPAFLIPKHRMSAENKPKAGDVVTFDYHSLSVEGVVTMVSGDTTDAEVIKATIVHFPWPGILRRYRVTEEDIYLKLSDEVFVIDHKGKEPYSPTEVVGRAKKEVGKTNHKFLTYRSSHLSRYCKTGEKKLKDLPKRRVNSIEDVSPGDVIEFKYHGFPHEAVVIKIGYVQNVETKVVHFDYNGLLGSRTVVEENIEFNLSKDNNYIHEYIDTETYEAEEVVRRARSRVGEKTFNVFTNRSSHIAKWCKMKKH